MKITKIIKGSKVVREKRGVWNVIATGGRNDGKPQFTGSLKECRAAIVK